MKDKFRISITALTGVGSLALLLVFVFILVDSLQSVRDIRNTASSVRMTNLPAIIESQRSFINIEAMRRLAEVAYTSEDPRKRREVRISARALAVESVFGSTAFHAEARKMASLIADLVSSRDAAHANRLRMMELGREYLDVIIHLFDQVNDIEVLQKVVQTFRSSSLLLPNLEGSTLLSSLTIRRLQQKDWVMTQIIHSYCTRNLEVPQGQPSPCDRLNEIYTEYSNTLDELDKNLGTARSQWTQVDIAIREMRDSVSSDSEFTTTDALSSIESRASNAANSLFTMLVGGGLFILSFIFVQHLLIAKPIRWVGQKLTDIQKGNVHTPMPSIRIRELYHVADLLDRFSDHLAELTSRASLLAEDAAEKKDLEMLMNAVFQLSVDGYAILSPEGLVTVNRELLRLLGLPDIEAMSKEWSRLGLPDWNDPDAPYALALQSGFEHLEMYLTNTGGVEVPFEICLLPMKRQGNECILAYFRDLSGQKQTESILRDAKDRAEEAAQVKSDFLARMSHEIRTPMNGVIGLTNLALSNDPVPKQREYLEKIQSSARILLGVINDVLDFSKLESGRMQLEERNFSISRLLGTVRDLFATQAADKGLDFKIETASDIPRLLKGDELRLSQVLLNLCGNALKFTERGSVLLSVARNNETAESISLQFTVTDSGVGITEEQQARLFEPFAQADLYTTRKYGGSGLGLVISKSLVEMMQGTIEMTSVAGQGSSFSFSVILGKVQEDTEVAECTQDVDTGTQALQGKRALLVEDNEINQEVALALLEGLGMEVTLAGDGQEALNILAENSDFDVVFMDIQMPVMDGITAARHIRQNPDDALRNIPIIAMTAHAMQEDREKSLAVGMNGHIVKPIDVPELLLTLLKALD